MRLRSWIPVQNLTFAELSRNESEGAIRLLETNKDKIHWRRLSGNKSEGAIHLLEANPDKIDWFYLSANKSEGAIAPSRS